MTTVVATCTQSKHPNILTPNTQQRSLSLNAGESMGYHGSPPLVKHADTLKLAHRAPAFSSVESHELAESLWGNVLQFLNNQVTGCYKVVVTFPPSL